MVKCHEQIVAEDWKGVAFHGPSYPRWCACREQIETKTSGITCLFCQFWNSLGPPSLLVHRSNGWCVWDEDYIAWFPVQSAGSVDGRVIPRGGTSG